MGDSFQKAKAGDPLRIPATAYNAFIDAARHAQGHEPDIGAGPPGAPRPAGTVTVKNDSGLNVVRFGVLGVTGLLYGPDDSLDGFKNRPVLLGDTPTADHAGAFVVLLQPLTSGGIGLGVVAGVVIVKVNVTDAEHEYADVEDGSAVRLASAVVGSAQILWAEGGTGEQWAVVRLSGPPRLGTADSPVTILPEDYETETAQSDAWDRDDQGETDGVEIRLTTRVAYNDAGDELVYAFYRTFTFDSLGVLKAISTETRVLVDTPGPCD